MKRSAIVLMALTVVCLLGAIWAGPDYRWEFILTSWLLGGISLVIWGMVWNDEAREREFAEVQQLKSIEALRRDVTGEGRLN